MKRLLLAGGGQTHALVLRELARAKPADVEIVLVTPSRHLPYSGMLPGWIAGHYSLEEIVIDLDPLVRAAGARLISAHVQTLDLASRTVRTDTGETIGFDTLSIATGATLDVDAIPGARQHALSLRPLDGFIAGWQQIRQRAAAARDTFHLTVIGAGAGGVECALAAAYRLHSVPSVQVQLVTGGLPILPGHGARARSLMRAALRQANVNLIDGVATKLDGAMIELANSLAVSTDATLLVTGASALAWPAQAGLAVDDRGFIAVNAFLQSTSHAWAFAAGDVASLTHAPRPKSGVYALRAAVALANNLIAATTGQPMSAFRPQRLALYLLTTGARNAIASWGPWAFAGKWVWRWKNSIDRGYIAKLRRPTNPQTDP